MIVFLEGSSEVVFDIFLLWVCEQNPNALDSKALPNFDHVKNGLQLDDEG